MSASSNIRTERAWPTDAPDAFDQIVDWEDFGRCRTDAVPTDLFFSDDLGDIAAAKRICAGCPVLAPCLEAALERAEPCGVWGGQLFANGRTLAHKRPRGRPPKRPRPEDQLPVVPVPEHLVARLAG